MNKQQKIERIQAAKQIWTTKKIWTKPTLTKLGETSLNDVEGLRGNNAEATFTSLPTS